MWPPCLLVLLLAFQTNYEQGIKALDEKRYDAAIESFTKAAADDPKDYTAYFNLALAYSLQSKDAEAVPAYKKTLELKPDLYQANLNLGITLLRMKQNAEAVSYLASAAAAKPNEYRPNYNLGAALLGAGEAEKSQQAFTAALAADPKSPDAELGLAHALARLNNASEAEAHYRKAASLNPAYRNDLLELGSLYEAQGQSKEAIGIYQEFPENAAAQERLGVLLIGSEKPGDAIPHLEFAVSKSPTAANRAALATAYLKNNQPDKALPLAEQMLASNPNDFDIRMLRGRILRDQRKFAEAAQDFQIAAKLKPDSSQAWSELAVSLVLAENFEPALGALDRVAALGAEKPGHVYWRALVLDKINDRKGALANYQRFLAMSNGQNPDEEFKARQRAKLLERELHK
jgi:tetratricopeptide (TPR) repeat protein